MGLQLVRNIGNLEPFFYIGVPDEWNPGKIDNTVKYGAIPVEMFDIATSPTAIAFNEEIRSAEKNIKDWASKVTLTARTPLGKKLLALRAKIVASGEPLLTWDEIDTEVRKRRGEMD